jgi:hypothetical protein
MRLDDLVIPETPACSAALEVAAAYCSPALLNHSVRSYLWAAAYGMANEITFDAELLYVSAALHDIGLVREFDSHALPFEDAGGHVAWVFAAAAGWPVKRREQVAQVIVAHMYGHVDVSVDPEGHLLELATGLDIAGRRALEFPAAFRAEVLTRHPRLGLGPEFLVCFQDQAVRKPRSSAAASIRAGIGDEIAANVLDASSA